MPANPLAAINSVALAIGRFSSLDEMLDYALLKVLEVLETDAGGLYLLDEAQQSLTLVVHHGLSETAWRDFDHLPLGEGLSGRVAETGEPIVVSHLKDDPRLTRMAARSEGFCAFASVPLRSNFKTYGTLNVYTRHERDFSEQEVQLLTSMAAQIGLAVGNARLYLDLKASERRFRGLVENAEDVIYLTDRIGRIVYANPALDRLLGYGPDVLSTDEVPVLTLVHPDDRTRLADLLPRMLAGDVMRAVEFRVVHRDGSRVFWCSQTNVPLRDEAGAITGMQCIAQDVTTRKALEEQMVRAERLADLGRMAATIAHEIRNPLGAIVNVIRLLKHPTSSRDPRLLDIVAEEADRLDGIVSEVLSFARPPRQQPVPCDVRELVEHAVLLFREGAKTQPGPEIRITCPADVPQLRVDPNQMRQVIWNLLSNAAEASAGETTATSTPPSSAAVADRRAPATIDVDVVACPVRHEVEIRVTDDGPGLSEPESVLEPFFTTKAQGTGLGLAIVNRIVRDHGGSVQAANVPGRGARLTIVLPAEDAVLAVGAARMEEPWRRS